MNEKGKTMRLAKAIGRLRSAGLHLALTFITSCGSDQKPILRSGDLKNLDIRDGILSANALGGPGTSIDDVKEAKSVAAFASSVYPLSVKWCAGGCHDTVQAPVFASVDIKSSHDALLTTQKVDFKAVERSRIVLRVSEDNHNCPAEGCEVATKAFISAINLWEKSAVESGTDSVGSIVTPSLTLGDAVGTKKDLGLPPGTFLFEAESGTLKAPMVALPVADASGGMVVHTPAGAGSQTNITTAETQATLGSVTFDLDVSVAGNYRILGKVNAPATANSSFYLKLDQKPLLLWDFAANQAAYTYDIADAVQGVGTAHILNLTPGKHKVEVRQREEQTKLDTMIVTNDTELDPTMVKATPRDMKTLAFDISEKTGIPGAKLKVDVIDYSKNGYLLKNLSIDVPAGKIHIKGIKLLVNGVYLPQHATFSGVDASVASPGGPLSSASLVAIKDKGADQDEFSFSFDVLEKVP